jgi:hypothetical protein
MWIKDKEVIEEKNDLEIDRLEKEREDLVDKLFADDGFQCFKRLDIVNAPFNKRISKLAKEQKMERPIHLNGKIPDYGDRMTIEDFTDHANCGGFIDYDGFGTYIMDEKMSNIDIVPSDVKAGMIRKEFKEIIWFNR